MSVWQQIRSPGQRDRAGEQLLEAGAGRYRLYRDLPFLSIFHGPVILDLSGLLPRTVELSAAEYVGLAGATID